MREWEEFLFVFFKGWTTSLRYSGRHLVYISSLIEMLDRFYHIYYVKVSLKQQNFVLCCGYQVEMARENHREIIKQQKTVVELDRVDVSSVLQWNFSICESADGVNLKLEVPVPGCKCSSVASHKELGVTVALSDTCSIPHIQGEPSAVNKWK